MVFFYTNYTAETNLWWVRRVWMSAAAIVSLYYLHRLKDLISLQNKNTKKQLRIKRGNVIRNFNYHQYYQPKYRNSMKAKLYEELGDNYKPAYKLYEYSMISGLEKEELFEQQEKFEL